MFSSYSLNNVLLCLLSILSHLQDDCLFLIKKRKKAGQSWYDRAEIGKVSSLTISVEMKEVFGDI
jgi:hypothetical protein